MDFISTALVTLKQPTGMWVKILNAFRGAGSYIVAVILIALIVRVIFSLVDIVTKKVNMKNMKLNEKMKPELEAIQKKYGNDPNVLKMKQSEVYRKYQFSMMGTCLPMLVTMVLQFVIFLTLWNSLQAVANYNIVEKYENMKNVYASVIELNDEDTYGELHGTLKAAVESGKEYELKIDINVKASTLKLTLTIEGETAPYVRTDIPLKKDYGLEQTYNLLQKYVLEPKVEEETPPTEDEEGSINGVVTILAEGEEIENKKPEKVDYVNNGLNSVFKKLAEDTAEEYYIDTQEGFLWIKNVYKADSPSSPLFTKKEIKNYLSKYYSKDEKELQKQFDYEGKIFDSVVTAGIGQKNLGKNGYYILTILAVAISVLSMWLSNFFMRDKKNPNQQKQSKMMYFIMPIIFGIFTFMYTSLFAVYIITGQLVMMALTPLTSFIVKKWLAHDEKKKKDKNVIEVDYRRKDS